MNSNLDTTWSALLPGVALGLFVAPTVAVIAQDNPAESVGMTYTFSRAEEGGAEVSGVDAAFAGG